MSSVATSGSEDRKIRKPLMEKKRRARINESLEVLKNILLECDPDSANRSNSKSAKLEKADILEMTVSYLQRLKTKQKVGYHPYANHVHHGNFVTHMGKIHPHVDPQAYARMCHPIMPPAHQMFPPSFHGNTVPQMLINRAAYQPSKSMRNFTAYDNGFSGYSQTKMEDVYPKMSMVSPSSSPGFSSSPSSSHADNHVSSTSSSTSDEECQEDVWRPW